MASRVAGDRGDPVRERTLLDEAADLDDASPPVTRVHIAEGLACAELNYGDLDTARRHAERALALAERTDNVHGLIAAQQRPWRHRRKRCSTSIAPSNMPSHACKLAREIGDVHGEANARARLGIAVHLRGDAHGSLDDYAHAAAHYEAPRRCIASSGTRRSSPSP